MRILLILCSIFVFSSKLFGQTEVIQAQTPHGYFLDNKDYYFQEGKSIIKLNEKFVVLDKMGNKKFIKSDFEYASQFSENRAIFTIDDDKYGLIDSLGNKITKTLYERLNPTQTGYYFGRKFVGDWYKFGIIDKNENTILDFKFEGLEEVDKDIFISFNSQVRNIINSKGELLSPKSYKNLNYWGNGYYEGNEINSDVRKVFRIDNKPNTLIVNKYKARKSFNLELFKIKNNSYFGLINNEEKEVIPPIYDNLWPIGTDRILFVKSGLTGIIDYKNNIISKDSLSGNYIDMNRKPTLISPEEKDGYIGVGKIFKTELECEPSQNSNLNKKFIIIQNQLYAGVKNNIGQVIIPFTYDRIWELNYNSTVYFQCRKSEKDGIIDAKGKIIEDFKYDFIQQYPNSELLLLKSGNLYYLYNLNSNSKTQIIGNWQSVDTFSKTFVIGTNSKWERYLIDKKGIPINSNKKYDDISVKKNIIIVKYDNYTKIELLDFNTGNSIIPITENYLYNTVENKKLLIDKKTGKILKIIDFESLKIQDISDKKYEIYSFAAKSLVVKKDNKLGVIDYFGNEVIKTTYDGINCNDYLKYYSCTLNSNGKTYIYDETGKFILDSEIGNFNFFDKNKEYITGTKKDLNGIVNIRNEVILPFEYKYLIKINDSLLAVTKERHEIGNKRAFDIFNVNKRKVIFQIFTISITSNNFYIFEKDENIKTKSIYDFNGNNIMNFENPVSNISIFPNSNLLKYEDENHISKLYDLKNNKVLNYNFDFAIFEDSVWRIGNNENCYILDNLGNLLYSQKGIEFPKIPNELRIYGFDNKYYLKNKNGTTLYRIDEIKTINKCFYRCKNDTEVFYLNNQGEKLYTITGVDFKRYSQINDNLVFEKIKYGMIDKNGQEIIPFEYDFIGKYGEGLVYVEKGKKKGFINLKNEWKIILEN